MTMDHFSVGLQYIVISQCKSSLNINKKICFCGINIVFFFVYICDKQPEYEACVMTIYLIILFIYSKLHPHGFVIHIKI